MKRSRLITWPIVLVVAALAYLAAAVFWPVWDFEFVDLDEYAQVVDNPSVRGLDWQNLKSIVGQPGSGGGTSSYYPVRTLTFAMDYEVWGLNAGGYKLTNVALHWTNGVLVFFVILRLFRRQRAGGKSGRRVWELASAALGAALFAVHPVVVEPVAWISGREELLMTLGALGCLHLHLTAGSRRDRGRAWAARAYRVAAVLSCVAACLSNAVGAVIPLLITAVDLCVLPRPTVGKLLRDTAALWAVSAAAIFLKQTTSSEEMWDLPRVFTAEWLAVILNVYWLNLKTVFWPTRLAVAYNWPACQSLLDAQVILGGIAAALTCAVLWTLRRWKLVLLGLVWFCVALAPTSQIMSHHIARADRFLYLPLVGLALALAAGLRPLKDRLTRRAEVGGVIAVGLLCLALLLQLSAQQVWTWRDSRAMWENSLRASPNNSLVHSGLADSLARSGRFDLAIPHYMISLRIDPDSIETLNNFALRLAATEQRELRDYELAIRLAKRGCMISQGRSPKLAHTLSLACANYADELDNQGDFNRAIEYYRLAIAADPANDVPLFNLALLLTTCPDETRKDPAEAIRLAEQACGLTAQPDPQRLSILAMAYAEAGRFPEARATAEQAIRLAEHAGEGQAVEELGMLLEMFRKEIAPSSPLWNAQRPWREP